MKYRRFFGRLLLVGGLLFIITLVLFLVNNRLFKCGAESHLKLADTTQCYYYTVGDCIEGGDKDFIDDQEACVYNADTILSNRASRIILFGSIGLGFVFLTLYLVFTLRKRRPERAFREDRVEPDRAEDLNLLRFSERNCIPVFDGRYKKSAFKIDDREPFPRGDKNFLKIQFQALEGLRPGVFTNFLSLSDGEKSIKNGWVRNRRTLYDEFKIPNTMPLSVAKDPAERLLDRLWDVDPEEAARQQTRMLEQRASRPSPDEFGMAPQPPMMRPPPRRPYYPRRRYY